MDKEEIKKAFAEGISEFGAKVDTSIKAAVEPVQAEVAGLGERLKKIEALPIASKTFGINVIPGMYRGRNLENMGGKLYDVACKNPGKFQVFGNAEKLHEFKKYMIDTVLALAFKDAEAIASLRQRAAMAEGAATTGGNFVPLEYEWELIQLVRESSFALNACTVIPMGSLSLQLPSETTLCTAAWISEAGAITASDPVIGKVTLTAQKLACLTTAMSNELLADSMIDIPSWLSEQFGYAIVQELDNQVLNGTGSPVSGVMTAAAGYSAVMATGSTSTSNIYADIFRNAMRKLSVKDAVKASWVFGKDTRFYLETLKNSQTDYVYRMPNSDQFGAGNLWGRPVNEVAQAPAATATASTPIAVFGDFKQFYIGNRRGLGSIDVDPYSSFAADGTRFRLVTRWGLAVARASAFARVVTGASS